MSKRLAYITESAYSYHDLETDEGTTELTVIIPGFFNAKPYAKEGFIFEDLFPGKVIIKCRHCGQWAARKTACGYCGAPVD